MKIDNDEHTIIQMDQYHDDHHRFHFDDDEN